MENYVENENFEVTEYLDECNDLFNIVDKLLVCNLTPEDEDTICQIDLKVSDTNIVTKEQFDFIDQMVKKYNKELADSPKE